MTTHYTHYDQAPVYHNRQTTYNLFVSYFGNPKMTKIRNDGDHSIYMTHIRSMLANTKRYLVAIVDLDVFFPKEEVLLSNLRWKSFQTRSLQDKFEIQLQHTYKPNPTIFSNCAISIARRDPTFSEYDMDPLQNDNSISLKVLLLHKTNDKFEYPNAGTLSSALETYNTIIEFKSM